MNAYSKELRRKVLDNRDERGYGCGGLNDKGVFEACAEQVLAPAPEPGPGVLLDDPRAHGGERACKPVEAIGRAPSALALEDPNGWSLHRGYEVEARGL